MGTSNDRFEEELASLRALVEEQRARLEGLERHSANGNGGDGRPTSRRDLLKLAGAGLVGAAGSVALSALPAAAATGGNLVLGQHNTAESDTTLTLDATQTAAMAPIDYALQVDATNVGISDIGTPPAIHAIEAVGLGAGPGIISVSNGGTGAVFGSNVGPDIQLGGAVVTGFPNTQANKTNFGSGRLAQLQRSDVAAAGPPWTAAATISELVRGHDASLWLSTNGASSTASANWKRMNTVRVDKADGSGNFFQPIRIVDTRPSQGPVGGITGPLLAGTTYNFGPINGGVVVGGANNGVSMGIPDDAIGVLGNVTAAGYGSGQGFLAVFPKGASYSASSSPSSLNFGPPSFAWANAFTVGLGAGGFISVHVGGVNTHVIIDLVAYVQ